MPCGWGLLKKTSHDERDTNMYISNEIWGLGVVAVMHHHSQQREIKETGFLKANSPSDRCINFRKY